MKKYGIPIIALAAALFLTNPDRNDFEGFLQKKFEQDAEYKSEVGEFFGNLFGGALSELAAKDAVRKNYVLASTYQLGKGEDDDRYLGILTFFIKL